MQTLTNSLQTLVSDDVFDQGSGCLQIHDSFHPKITEASMIWTVAMTV